MCQVLNCKSSWRKHKFGISVSHFRFPRDKFFADEWTKATGRSIITAKDPRICKIHFSEDCYIEDWIQKTYNLPPSAKRMLKPDAIPTLHLPSCSKEEARQGDDFIVNNPHGSNDEIEEIKYSEIILKYEIDETDWSTQEVKNFSDIAVKSEFPDTSRKNIPKKKYSQMRKMYSKRRDQLRLRMILTEVRYKAQLEEKQKQLDEMAERCRKELVEMTENFRKEKMILQYKISEMEKERKQYIPKKNLSHMLTPGQIRLIENPDLQTVHWSEEDFAAAIAAYAHGHAAYEYWRCVRKLPMPAPSTLRKRAPSISFEPGILLSVFNHIGLKSSTMGFRKRLCVASFDEICISEQIDIDKKEGISLRKSTQVSMLRGLFDHWKQLVYYDYDTHMTQKILFDIIGHAYDNGYTVVCTVCDMSPSNQKLLSLFNIGIKPHEKRFFLHPKDPTCKVFMRYDDPHALKLIRNHWIDAGFELSNGARITTKSVWILARSQTPSDLKIDHTLLEKMLSVVGNERRKVKWAAKLFSRKVATAIRFLGYNGHLSEDPFWKETADFVELVNDWFDVCNASRKYGRHSGLQGYGVDLEKQNDVLDRMTTMMSTMRVITSEEKSTKRSPAIFQKSIILNNMALKELLPYLRSKYNTDQSSIEYLLTRQLNQDIIEPLRTSASDMRSRVRNYILGEHAGFNFGPNCKDDSSEDDESKDIMLTHDQKD